MVKMVVLSGASERADGSSEAVSTLCRTPHPAKANQLRTAAGSQPRRCSKKIEISADVFRVKEARSNYIVNYLNVTVAFRHFRSVWVEEDGHVREFRRFKFKGRVEVEVEG